MSQVPTGMQTLHSQMAAAGGMQGQLAPGMQAQMTPGMPQGYTWNGAAFPMMGDMSNLMFNNMMPAATNPAMMPANNGTPTSGSQIRSRRRSRSRSRSRDRDRSDERHSSKRRADAAAREKSPEQSQSVATMNPMMGMMAGNMMPMAGGMFPSNMMMGGYAAGMVPTAGIDMTAGSMELMGQAQMEMMNSASGDVNMMMPVIDPTMIGMTMGATMGTDMKELVLKDCKLTPPPIGTPLPPRRVKPPGCRTIFIGGLPDKVNEDHVREIFGRFGRIYTLRLSKKNFCHIRYERENSVDMAIAISGYKLRVTLTDKPEEETEDKANSGWLHVDFAFSRDDQNDYERKQKRLEREAARELERESARESARDSARDFEHSSEPALSGSSHRRELSRAERERSRERERDRRARSTSPAVRIQPYSTIIVSQIAEKIRSEDNFASAVPTLVAWLERGECQKKNAATFYAMIQATNGQIRRLLNEKMQVDEEFQQAKERAKKQYQKIITQLEQVAKVLTAAAHQRVWDHFSKPQRKNIETWQKMTEEFQAIRDEFTEKFNDEDNDYGDEKADAGELKKLKKEKENLQVQLEAYKNEMELVKADGMRDFEKWKAQYIATQALHNMSQNSQNQPPPPPPLAKPPPPPPLPGDEGEVKLSSEVDTECGEAKLIGVMSAFLQVHPRGASLDYVVSYVRAQFPKVNPATVRHVLEKHTDVFGFTTTGVGAGIEHRWMFVAFNS